MKPKKLLWGIASGVLALGLLAPGLAAADTVPETCGQYTCVRATLERISIYCFTNSERRPQCTATAQVGGVGRITHPDDYTFASLRVQAWATGGKVENPVPVPLVFRAPKFVTAERSFDRTATITRSIRAPFAVGGVGGCIEYWASFIVGAETWGDPYFEGIARVDATSRHSHNTKALTGKGYIYCVPQ